MIYYYINSDRISSIYMAPPKYDLSIIKKKSINYIEKNKQQLAL